MHNTTQLYHIIPNQKKKYNTARLLKNLGSIACVQTLSENQKHVSFHEKRKSKVTYSYFKRSSCSYHIIVYIVEAKKVLKHLVASFL